jgi:hypothetical protein
MIRSMTPNRLGLAIGAAFGLVYVVVNAGALPSPVGPVLRVLGVVAFVGVLLALSRAGQARSGDGAAGGGFGRGYWLVVTAEVVAIAVGNVLLNGALDLPQGVLPWISFVVGVHFLGLAKVWGAPSLAWLGGGIAVLGALGLSLASAGASEAAVASIAGIGPGALLLAGSAWGAAREGGDPAPEAGLRPRGA